MKVLVGGHWSCLETANVPEQQVTNDKTGSNKGKREVLVRRMALSLCPL